jgi:hypothetical protein
MNGTLTILFPVILGQEGCEGAGLPGAISIGADVLLITGV